MSIEKFCAKFGKDRVVLPVIHIGTYQQTLVNIELAKMCGADGVWLISHGEVPDQKVVDIQQFAIEQLNWSAIGINLLSNTTVSAFHMADHRSMGVWTDNAYVEKGQEKLREFVELNRDRLGDGLYFGGVAFKYQSIPDDVRKSAELAKSFVDVITTSGVGTGKAADIEKIKLIRKGAGDHPVAIASGITPENVRDYLPYVNAFMVATGININGDFYHIDVAKLKALVETVANYVV